MGMKHVALLRKPDAFQLGASDPDDPKVKKTIGQLGIGDPSKMPKPLQMVIAQLAFANSDLAFQGNHLFQGNFYGVNIYDISNPANATLVTSLVCPGGQGDVSVYKNLLFMSVEMPNGRLDCGVQGFPAGTSSCSRGMKKNVACLSRKKIDSAACASSTFPTSRIRNRSRLYRLAVARIPTLWSRIRAIRTMSISMFRGPRLCAKRTNLLAARVRNRTRIPIPLCFASM